jgi:hypothetical protein
MSVAELKGKIQDQIDLLTEEKDLEDLYETICLFFENRQINVIYSDDFVSDLEQRATEAHQGIRKGITTEALKAQMKEWLTK